MVEWTFETRSGSIYRVQHRNDNTWWVTARNVPNRASRPWPEGKWVEVDFPDAQYPFANILGERLELTAKVPFPNDVMTAGYLTTSPVVDVTTVFHERV